MTRERTMLAGTALREELRTGATTHRALVDAYLARIDADDAEIGAFLFVDRDGVRAAADAFDRAHAAGQALGPLAGYVLAIKDNIAVSGMPMTAGSKILEGYRPPYEATVVTRLRNAGALIIGKTNLDEFAMGASTEQSGFRPTRNPRDRSRVPGGSSGGSAAAVAAGFCTAALGSDTGGSIRQPAAFCGLVGMRPTYGFVSRSGLVAMASSMDIIGPLARTTEDSRVLLAVMAGYDPSDATTVPDVRVPEKPAVVEGRTITVGIPQEYREGITDAAVRNGFDAAVRALENAGVTVVEVSLPTTPYAVPTYYVITPAEASSNLARYDGIGYGPSAHRHLGHSRAYAALRDERFGSEPKRRALLGSFTLSAGFADRYYHTAQRVRTLLRQDFAAAFDRVDVLMTPATPTVAFPLGSVQDPVAMYRQDIFLAAVSLAGVPALSLPSPVPSGSLPVGIQLIGAQGTDVSLLGIAGMLERAMAVKT